MVLLYGNSFALCDKAATYCDRMAWLSNDPRVQEKYLKKAILFWDTCLEKLKGHNTRRRLHHMQDAALTYYRASQHCSDPHESKLYYHTAIGSISSRMR